MQPYRFYFITAAGRIVGAEVVECANDTEAVAKAHALLAEQSANHAIEVWDRARHVATVSPG